jgi:hypothetical protein
MVVARPLIFIQIKAMHCFREVKMIFIENHKGMIALVAVFSFLYMVGISSMPLAANTQEQISSASMEQGPGYVEAVTQKVAPAKKKSILPMLLIGVGVVAVAAVLILVVFKTKYDITGTWAAAIVQDQDQNRWEADFIFTGDKKSGTAEYREPGFHFPGTYAVNGKDVNIVIDFSGFNPPAVITFAGSFSAANSMSGTWVSTSGGSGTWSAKKN